MNGEEPRSLIEKLEHVDRRVIFLLVGLAIILPLFTSWSLSPKKTPPVTDFYKFIESLPAGTKIVVSDDWDPGSKAELETASIAVLSHAFKRNLRVIDMTLWGTGAILVDDTLEKTARKFGKKYGEDYVSLGFKEGREVIMQGVAQNMRTIYPKDYRGNDINDLPIMDGVDSLEDVAGLVSVSAGYPGTKEWVQQVQSRFDIPMIAICAGVSEPEYQPYYKSGQLKGLIGGLPNMAAYEQLTGSPGFASRAMVAQSSGHYVLGALIILGNIFYAISTRRIVIAIILTVVGGGFYVLTLATILF